jgi:hypothetical protein
MAPILLHQPLMLDDSNVPLRGTKKQHTRSHQCHVLLENLVEHLDNTRRHSSVQNSRRSAPSPPPSAPLQRYGRAPGNLVELDSLCTSSAAPPAKGETGGRQSHDAISRNLISLPCRTVAEASPDRDCDRKNRMRNLEKRCCHCAELPELAINSARRVSDANLGHCWPCYCFFSEDDGPKVPSHVEQGLPHRRESSRIIHDKITNHHHHHPRHCLSCAFPLTNLSPIPPASPPQGPSSSTQGPAAAISSAESPGCPLYQESGSILLAYGGCSRLQKGGRGGCRVPTHDDFTQALRRRLARGCGAIRLANAVSAAWPGGRGVAFSNLRGKRGV